MQELGIATAQADGTALSESELRANILARSRALKSRADSSSILANDDSLADCTVGEIKSKVLLLLSLHAGGAGG
eukprot:47279-Eustigmatos_ZCMA.PRE.1